MAIPNQLITLKEKRSYLGQVQKQVASIATGKSIKQI